MPIFSKLNVVIFMLTGTLHVIITHFICRALTQTKKSLIYNLKAEKETSIL